MDIDSGKRQQSVGSQGVTEVILAALDFHVGVQLQKLTVSHGRALLIVSICSEENRQDLNTRLSSLWC